MTDIMTTLNNKLYFGDNLAVMREHIHEACVDLVYLDPPFNSKATYNVLFKEKNGTESAAQIVAFDDTWHWDAAAAETYHDLVTRGPKKLADLVIALHSFLGANDMMAYLIMMAVRLVEMRRVLKDTGSIYLHCDPTASHYLKLVLDAVFGKENFRTEIVWKRSSAHSDAKQGRKQHGRIHDVIFFYTKSDDWKWNNIFTPYDEDYTDAFYRFQEPGTGRRCYMGDLTAARPGGDTLYEWRVKKCKNSDKWESDLDNEWKTPKDGWEYKGMLPYQGRFWAYSKANMIIFAKEGRLIYTSTGMPRHKRYLDEMQGVPLQDLWSDIPPALGKQDLGYPTQKPEALLERIIRASSNEGDLVLDPFCGCGTTVNVAEHLHRRWIGIDITHLAITLIKHRLDDTFGQELAPYEILGDPKDIESARALAAQNRHQFEWWALSLVDARPAQDRKKGADKGVDGYLYFFDEENGPARKVVVQVKSGHVNAAQIRDLKGTIEREKAVIGVFITLDEPTAPMRAEAADAGFYEFRHIISGQVLKFPRIQIFTVEELLAGAMLKMPAHAVEDTIKKAARKKKEKQWGGEILLL